MTMGTISAISRLSSADFSSKKTQLAIAGVGIVLAIIGLWLIIAVFRDHPAYPSETDLSIYLRSADAIAHGENPYLVHTAFDRYPYPPLLADTLAVLKALVGRQRLYVFWPTLSCVCLLTGMRILARGFGVKLGVHWVILFAGILLLSQTNRLNIYHGNPNPIDFCLLTAGLGLYTKERNLAASFCFALMICLKPFLGFVLLYFLLRREWEIFGLTLLVSASTFFASFLPTAPNMTKAFVAWKDTSAYFSSPYFASKPDNKSFYGLFLRLFTETPFSHPWVDRPLLVPAGIAFVVLLVLAIIWFGFRTADGRVQALAPRRAAVRMFECSIIFAFTMACGPLTEGGYMLMALPGLVAAIILGSERIAAGSIYRPLWISAIVAWAIPTLFVLAPYVVAVNGAQVFNPDDARKITGLRILLTGRTGGLLLLAGALSVLVLWRERNSTECLSLRD